MPMWRCPHCGTPQPEAARCWVCHRSSTTCSMCRHFRQSLAASVGYCGLDRRRAPLHGTEHRGCWEPRAATPAAPSGEASLADARPDAARATVGRPADALNSPVARLRQAPRPRPGIMEGFVPIELAARPPRVLEPVDPVPAPPPAIIERAEPWTDRETLFGDL